MRYFLFFLGAGLLGPSLPTRAQDLTASGGADLTQQILQNAPNATKTKEGQNPPKLSSPEPNAGAILAGFLVLGVLGRTFRAKKHA